MGRLLHFFILMVSPFIVCSQEIEMKGSIMIDQTEAISYKLVFGLDNSIIQGYSICNQFGKDETKALISGFLNVKEKTMQFKELRILRTKSSISLSEFCLMQVEGKFVTKKGIEFFQGKFKSTNKEGKVYCDGGTIILNSNNLIYNAPLKLNKRTDTIKEEDNQNINLNNNSKESKLAETIKELYSNQSLLLNWNSDSVRLEIRDDKIEDGDVITIEKDNKILVKNLKITNLVKVISFPLQKNHETILTITAISEGIHPPNTVAIYLVGKNERQQVLSQLVKNQKATIVFKK
ncbi:MAG: hypothetical protein ABIO44_02730 [Saprospiraceae bacterium]